jgi:hypothetical protein
MVCLDRRVVLHWKIMKKKKIVTPLPIRDIATRTKLKALTIHCVEAREGNLSP